MRTSLHAANLTHSRGIALIAGLLLMASMVLLALAVANGMLLEQRMTGNFADGQLALQRAQQGDQWAGYWLGSRAENPLASDCDTACGPTPPVFSPGTLPSNPEYESAAWWKTNAVAAGLDPQSGETRFDYSLSGVPQPLWLIEELHLEPMEALTGEGGEPQPEIGYYRVLSRGQGRLPGSVVVSETIVARPWAPDITAAALPPAPDSEWFCAQFEDDVPCGRLAWRRRR